MNDFILSDYVSCTLYLLAILNPISKVLFLASQQPVYKQKQINLIATKTNLFCLIFLFLMAMAGQFLFAYIFKIHIDSLRFAGGVIMFILGINMMQNISQPKSEATEGMDVSIVPLAIPMTAGAGTIVVVNTFAAMYTPWVTYPSIITVLLINTALMLLSRKVGRFLIRAHLIEPAYRLTGLLLVAMAAEMSLTGFFGWLKNTLN